MTDPDSPTVTSSNVRRLRLGSLEPASRSHQPMRGLRRSVGRTLAATTTHIATAKPTSPALRCWRTSPPLPEADGLARSSKARRPGRTSCLIRGDTRVVLHRKTDVVEAVDEAVLREIVDRKRAREPGLRRLDRAAFDVDGDLKRRVGPGRGCSSGRSVGDCVCGSGGWVAS